MTNISERLKKPISTAELERRWGAVRAAMRVAKIDVLLMQNNNEHMGGYVKYFTDIPAVNGYPLTIVFPVDEAMTAVSQGPFGGEKAIPSEGDGVWRGVKLKLNTPSYASCPYTAPYDPELAARGIEPYAKGTIGLVGGYQMSVALVDHMRNAFPEATFVDASDLVDQIKVIKSPEEQELVRLTAKMQDGAMRAVAAAVEPGMRDSDIAAIAQHYSQQHGSEHGIYLCGSSPLGTPAMIGPRHNQNRIMQEGDYFLMLVEDSGPGGMYTELGRTFVLGEIPQQMQDEFGFTLEARQFTLNLLKPGTPCKTIWDEYNAFMIKNGRSPEARIHCHGQGYDLVERPLIRHDEPLPIQANTNIVVHPTYTANNQASWVCDNYLIGEDGPGGRLQRFPEQIVEIR